MLGRRRVPGVVRGPKVAVTVALEADVAGVTAVVSLTHSKVFFITKEDDTGVSFPVQKRRSTAVRFHIIEHFFRQFESSLSHVWSQERPPNADSRSSSNLLGHSTDLSL